MAGGDDNTSNDVTQLLVAVDRGESGALDRLITAIYPELKRLAHSQLAGERRAHTLNTTAVVHEAFLRLCAGARQWSDRRHFLRAAAKVMRHLLVDHARRRNADKRGAGTVLVSLDEERSGTTDETLAVIALDSALCDIAAIDPRLEQIVECRYFAGLSVAETADALGIAVRTVERDSQRARGYLRRAMGAGGGG